MQVYDRELLEQEAIRLGVPAAELEKIDERGAGIFQRFHPGSIYQRYFAALGQLMHELSNRGDLILVGRGGSRILRDDPRAFHVRLVASGPIRVRRVMEYRWVQENVAKKLIAESDSRRASFYESYFGADWFSPLEYDLTVNNGRLGPTAVEIVDLAAEHHWSRRHDPQSVRKFEEASMEQTWGIAAVWLGLALLASLISIRLKLSVALVEILVGIAAGNLGAVVGTLSRLRVALGAEAQRVDRLPGRLRQHPSDVHGRGGNRARLVAANTSKRLSPSASPASWGRSSAQHSTRVSSAIGIGTPP